MPTSHSDLCKRPQPRTLFIICRKKKSFDVYPRRPCGHTKKRPKGACRRCLLGNSFKRNWSTTSSARVQTDRTHDVKFMRKNGGTKMYLSFKIIIETPCTQFVGSSSSSTYPCIQVYKLQVPASTGGDERPLGRMFLGEVARWAWRTTRTCFVPLPERDGRHGFDWTTESRFVCDGETSTTPYNTAVRQRTPCTYREIRKIVPCRYIVPDSDARDDRAEKFPLALTKGLHTLGESVGRFL